MRAISYARHRILPVDAEDRSIYDKSAGNLFYDGDGTGAGLRFGLPS
jgi:hypothetical protein